MSASLVGSEMCIRDRCGLRNLKQRSATRKTVARSSGEAELAGIAKRVACLLYTSDAADDM
eukprot:10216841-Alexandrium_andersonii.AAC.1